MYFKLSEYNQLAVVRKNQLIIYHCQQVRRENLRYQEVVVELGSNYLPVLRLAVDCHQHSDQLQFSRYLKT